MIYLVDIPTGGKGKGKKGKGRGDMEMVEGTIIKDFRTEYAKSGAAKCRTCEEKIPKVCLFEPRSDVKKHTILNRFATIIFRNLHYLTTQLRARFLKKITSTEQRLEFNNYLMSKINKS